MISNKGDDVPRLKCPYNDVHRILKPRMQQHLVKCRVQCTSLQYEICPNNTTHRIPVPEMPFHTEICPDRHNIDKFMYITSESEDKFPMPTLNLQAEENWDDDHHATYNPEEHCVNNPILRNKNVLPQAERRRFRLEERQRMQKFQLKEKEETPKEAEEKAVSKARRPHGVSGGVVAATNAWQDDITSLITQIQLGSKIAVLPAMASTSKENETYDNDTAHASGMIKHNTPLSGDDAENNTKRTGPIIKKRGRGRGRGLGYK